MNRLTTCLLLGPGRAARMTAARRSGRLLGCGFCVAALLWWSADIARGVTIDFVTVGDSGNAGQPQFQGTFGAVAYAYRIGKYEVTNQQYVALLNAKTALGDPLGLFNPNMQSDPRGGISRSGTGISGDPFVYTARPNMGNKPVNYVSWYDCVRFANWLNNGQGTGDTENGAYKLLGNSATPTNGLSVVRDLAAKVWLPSENEWYKAAYFEPGASGDNYWDYATRSDVLPTMTAAAANGDVANPGANVANFNRGADWNGQDGNVTTVGGAGPLSESHYLAADMNGNVSEWNEALIFGVQRGIRGGAWINGAGALPGSGRNSTAPTDEFSDVGFRVATVPEPATPVLLAVGLAACLTRRLFVRWSLFK